jgi:hypothetical protein
MEGGDRSGRNALTGLCNCSSGKTEVVHPGGDKFHYHMIVHLFQRDDLDKLSIVPSVPAAFICKPEHLLHALVLREQFFHLRVPSRLLNSLGNSPDAFWFQCREKNTPS